MPQKSDAVFSLRHDLNQAHAAMRPHGCPYRFAACGACQHRAAGGRWRDQQPEDRRGQNAEKTPAARTGRCRTGGRGMSRVLVTGAGGFIGGALCAHLTAAGVRVFGSVRGDLDLETGDIGALLAQVAPEAIVHCAGRLGEPADEAGRQALFASNHLAAERLLQAAARMRPLPRVVLVASAAIYAPMADRQPAIAEDHPTGPVGQYGASKAAAVILAQAMTARGDLPVVTAVPFNVLGPGQPARLVPQAFVTQLRARPASMRVGDLTAVRDWVDVRDVAAALAALAAPGVEPGLYNIASGTGITTGDLLDRLCSVAGVRPDRIADAAVVARPTVSRSIGDPAKIAAATGWHPAIPLESSLAAMWAAG